MSASDPSQRQDFYLRIPSGTFLKILAFAGLTALFIEMRVILMCLFLAVLIAVTVEPLLIRLEKKMSRWIAVVGIAIVIAVLLFLIIGAVVPQLVEQVGLVIRKIPELLRTILSHIPGAPSTAAIQEKINETEIPGGGWVPSVLVAGQFAAGGLTGLILTYVFTIYLMLDGQATYQWVLGFFPERIQDKMDQTSREVYKIISAYVIAQGITSLICAAYTYIALILLDVPAALMLAVLAGLFDMLPILGFFMAGIPAILFALTVSPVTALIVLGLYVLYHLIESYFLLPLIYGNRLRLSGLTVILALLVGGTAGGVLGAIIILPVVASYPIIERIWLAKALGRKVIEQHEATDFP